jgi:hypothetical protein
VFRVQDYHGLFKHAVIVESYAIAVRHGRFVYKYDSGDGKAIKPDGSIDASVSGRRAHEN